MYTNSIIGVTLDEPGLHCLPISLVTWHYRKTVGNCCQMSLSIVCVQLWSMKTVRHTELQGVHYSAFEAVKLLMGQYLVMVAILENTGWILETDIMLTASQNTTFENAFEILTSLQHSCNAWKCLTLVKMLTKTILENTTLENARN